MPRLLSPFIQGLFDQAAETGERAFNAQVGMSISLNNGVVYHVGTASMTMNSISRKGASVAITPIVFEGRAVSLPGFRHNQGSVPDAGEMALINLDYIFSQLIPEPTRLFENSSAKVYIAFPKSDGTYEGVLYFRGLVRIVSGDDDEAPFSLISDLSDKHASVAEEVTQRCLNELGDHVVGGRCGATHLPLGAVCSKDFDDEVAGCVFWGQMHAFWGIPFINPTGLIAGYGGPTTGGWSGDGPLRDGCVDPGSWIKRASGQWDRGYNLKVGDQTLDLRGRIGTIAQIERKYVEYRYLIECSNGAKLRCSADHPLTTSMEDDTGKQAYTIRPYLAYLNGDIDEPDRLLTETPKGISLNDNFRFHALSGGEVLKISMEPSGSKNYVAGVNPGFGIEGHNLKPIFDLLYV